MGLYRWLRAGRQAGRQGKARQGKARKARQGRQGRRSGVDQRRAIAGKVARTPVVFYTKYKRYMGSTSEKGILKTAKAGRPSSMV